MQTKKSPSLPELQGWMRGVLTHPKGVGQALNASKTYLHVIGETPQVSRETRLAIYGDGYFGRIVDVLGANFSSVKNTVGTHPFHHLAHDYLVKHPSTFRSIDDIGHLFSVYLKTHALTKKFKFLPDLAQLEWAAHQSFFADDVAPLKLSQLKSIPGHAWENAVFTLDPSVRLLALNWPVDDLWRDDGEWSLKKLTGLKKGPIKILVFRRADKKVRVPRLSAVQFDLLIRLQEEKTLGQALLDITKKHAFNEETIPVNAWFQEWVENGVIKRIKIPGSNLRGAV